MKFKLLFNPFERFQETVLLGWGTVALLLGSGLAYFFQARFDGVLDLHFTNQVEFWQPFADNLINIISLMVFLGALGFWMNKKTRLIDILAVCVMARIPYYPLSVFNLKGYMVEISEEILKDPMAIMGGNIALSQLFVLFIFSGFSLLAIIWQLVLLYNGTKVASNGKGIAFTVLFILAIAVAEILSKLLINY